MAKPNVSKALTGAREKFAAEFAKAFGEGSLERFEDTNPYVVIPTGSISLDMALGVGGLVVGRLHEWWGTEGIGKTSLALNLVAQAQAAFPDQFVSWVDMERTFDWPWAIANGVDPNRLWLMKPSSAEEAADAVKKFTSGKGVVSLVVLDSIGAMIAEKEKEKGAGDAVVGNQAKIVTRMVKMAAVECSNNNTTLLMINQVRANIGYGADTTTGGGWALKHCTTTKVKFGRTGSSPLTVGKGEDKTEVGHEVACRVERNKVSLPRLKGEFVLLRVETTEYGPIGVDRADEACRLGIKYGIIGSAGSWFTLPLTGERVQGREKVLSILRESPDIVTHIRTQLLAISAKDVLAEEQKDDPPADEDVLVPVFIRPGEDEV